MLEGESTLFLSLSTRASQEGREDARRRTLVVHDFILFYAVDLDVVGVGFLILHQRSRGIVVSAIIHGNNEWPLAQVLAISF